ncbi:hypothetical protein KSP40_PGU003890 [Platanthera guangdongensis]|uniref:Non-structural maintenance of chromosomes element 1 homolog n=1 Tax=Platanthera guangdongensis TaxID=2320717 RepID=A0ABR2MZB4_9ASPA
MATQLGWKHHTLIQALLSRGPLKEAEFHAIFAGATGKNPVTHKQVFNDCLLQINKELDYVQFELRACMNQYDGDIYYGVVNNVSDEQSKLGNHYSVPQIMFYKAIIEAIIQDGTNQGCITNIEALNIHLENQLQDGQSLQDSQSRIPAAFKNFTISQKEKTLSELIHDRWLSSTSDGKIGLGVRSFLDLRSWFRNNDVLPCHVCNEAAIKAEQCPKEGCSIRMHSYCLKKKFYKQKVARVCPGCSTMWHPSDRVEEDGNNSTRAQLQGNEYAGVFVPRKKRTGTPKTESVSAADAQSRAPSVPVKRNLRSCKAENFDPVDGEPSVCSPDPPAVAKRTRRSARM